MRTRKRLRQRKQRRQRYRLTLTVIALAVLSVAVGATTAAFTATNTVATSRATNKFHTISVPELTPANCTDATFYRISGPGGLNRFEAGYKNDTNQIWLGTSERDNNMGGGNGIDCMVPGGNSSGQAESVGGGAGNDYCYSGPGPGPYTFANSCVNGTRPTGPYTTVISVSDGF